MRKLTFFLACLFLIGVGLVNAQTRSVSGKVVSADDGEPIIGATVVVKGTTQGTITLADGSFQLSVPQAATTLVVSYIGMKTVEVNAQNGVLVRMQSDARDLDEVIVVAYGTAKKSSFTGSASTIGGDQIANRSITNLTNAIEGKSPGVVVNSGSGQPGEGVAVRIRGFGSVNASNAPLYIVDGIPFDGAISSISSDDIESMTILKDAASTSLYGSRAANGIVMITTKRGKADRTRVNFKATTGVVTRGIKEQEKVGPRDFMMLSWETFRNQHMFPASGAADDALVAGGKASTRLVSATGLMMNPYNVAGNQIINAEGVFNDTASLRWADDLDWFGAIQRTGIRQDYSTSISGGTDRSQFFSSLGYLNEKGYVMNSDFERFSARVNADSKVTSYLRTGINLNASRSKSSFAATETSNSIVNPFNFARNMGPIYPIHRHDAATGEYVLDENGEKIYDYLTPRPTGAFNGRHVVAETLWNYQSYIRNVIGARAFAEITFLKDFKFTLNGAGDFSNYKESVHDNPKVGDGAPSGRGRREFADRATWNINQVLSYDKTFGDHNISAKAIHENYNFTYEYTYGFRQGIIASGINELVNYTTTNELTSYSNYLRRESYLGNVEYNYKDKYYLSGNYNYSGTSKFSKANRWGSFWGVGASWRIDQEDFMKDITAVNALKLRSSYGQIGNDDLLTSTGALDYYPDKGLYELGTNNANEAGFWIASVARPGLQWEKNSQFDVALEFTLFNRVRGVFEFYDRQSANLLFKEPKPVSSGISEVWTNIGTMYNRGFEVSVSVDAVKTRDFMWTVDLIGATNVNKITKMPKNLDGTAKEIISGTKKLSEGHSLYEFWMRKWYGVDPANGAALYYAENTKATTEIKIIGTDTLSTNINNAKYHYTGSSIPTVQGSFTNTLKYKSLDFSFMLVYSLGGKIYDATYASLMSSGNVGGAKHVDLMQRWSKAGDVTNVPRMDDARSAHHSGISDRFLISRSYLSFKNIQLGYTFPKTWMKAIEATDGRLFVTGEDLFILSARKGMNVNQSFAGVTSNVYDPAKVITVGVNFTF